jgi:hypothetical protein
MKIKRFVEKVNYSYTIQDYFSDLEDYLDSTEIELTELNPNFYEVEIYPNDKQRKIQRDNTLSVAMLELNYVREKNKWQLECLKYIENAIMALENDDNVERIIFKEVNGGFSIKINTTITTNDDEWFSITDNDLSYDEFKIKKIMKDKFDIKLLSVSDDFDDDYENYILFIFEGDINTSDVVRFIKSKRLADNSSRVFKHPHIRKRDGETRISFGLNNRLNFR